MIIGLPKKLPSKEVRVTLGSLKGKKSPGIPLHVWGFSGFNDGRSGNSSVGTGGRDNPFARTPGATTAPAGFAAGTAGPPGTAEAGLEFNRPRIAAAIAFFSTSDF